ncbi:3-oxoacyl-[acyl-carrier-protein] synthase III C-terminal domain-containing protein [Bacillus anthracis]|uniref:3-oxoacyl-ACP synthase III family protein n=1 Tax=Bacillus anthracis TaxID=1392 RepID=UPI003D212F90
MESVGIRGINIYFPKQKYYTKALIESEIVDEKVFRKIGVDSVPIADNIETPTGMGIKAAKDLLLQLQVDPDEIDLVIYTGATPPDYFVWSPAAKICNELKMSKAFGFEVQLGCGGVQPAFQTAKAMLQTSSEWKKALIVAADIWSGYTKEHYGAGLIFGDSSAAALLEKSSSSEARLVDFCGYTDGKFANLAHVTSGTPYSEKIIRENPKLPNNCYTIMNKELISELYQNNIENYCMVASRVLEKSQWNLNDVDYLILPSGRIDLMKKIASVLNFNTEKTNISFLKRQGDLGAPGMLVDLYNMFKEFSVRKGNKILVLSAGVGISWMGLTIEI